MTVTATERSLEKPRLLRELIASYIELDDDLTGPGLLPWHQPLLDGYVRTAAAILTDQAAHSLDFLHEVKVAFLGLVGAVAEDCEFQGDVDGYLNKRNLPGTYAPVMADILDSDLETWTARLYEARPVAKVVGP